ncbi:MAG: hypothetical protein ACOCV8_05145 [Spirochaetota bacterium]
MKAIFLFYRDFLQPTPLGVGLLSRKGFSLYLTKLNSTAPLRKCRIESKCSFL